MADGRFLGYVGPPDIHDSTLESLDRAGDALRVHLRTYAGRKLTVSFAGVVSVHAVHPVGMFLCALTELECLPPSRRFVFANWEEPEEDDSALEIEAASVHVGPG